MHSTNCKKGHLPHLKNANKETAALIDATEVAGTKLSLVAPRFRASIVARPLPGTGLTSQQHNG